MSACKFRSLDRYAPGRRTPMAYAQLFVYICGSLVTRLVSAKLKTVQWPRVKATVCQTGFNILLIVLMFLSEHLQLLFNTSLHKRRLHLQELQILRLFLGGSCMRPMLNFDSLVVAIALALYACMTSVPNIVCQDHVIEVYNLYRSPLQKENEKKNFRFAAIITGAS